MIGVNWHFRTASIARAQQPVITDINPGFAPASGGTQFTIVGNFFKAGSQVDIGGLRAAIFERRGLTQVVGESYYSVLKVIVPPAPPGMAEVRVINPGGLYDSWLGGIQYFAPLSVTSVMPIFANPTGGTVITVTGTGFIPGNTVEPGTFIDIDGVPASDLTIISPEKLQATLPPGPFGPANLIVTNPGFQTPGFDRLVLYQKIRYGLNLTGSAEFADSAPKFMMGDPLYGGKLLYASGGLFNDGNHFLYPAKVAGLNFLYGSYDVVGFDVSDPADPLPAVGRTSAYTAGELAAIKQKYDENPESVIEPSRAPDARGLAVTELVDYQGQERRLLLVANGAEGLLVMDIADPLAMTVLARITTGGLAAAVTVLDNLALVSQSSDEGAGEIAVYDLTDPAHPLYLESLPGGGAGSALYQGKLFTLNTPIHEPDYDNCSDGGRCPEIPTPIEIGKPQYPQPRYTGTFGQFDSLEEYEGVSGSVAVIDLENPGRPVVFNLPIVGAAVDLDIQGNLLAVAAETAGCYLFDLTNPASPQLLSRLQPPAGITAIPGRYTRVELRGPI